MKIQRILILLLLSFLFTACNDKVDPVVDTLFISGGDLQSKKSDVISKLYEYYANSKKDKEFYEIVAKGEFIINYYPEGKLLTLCVDPGSGWSNQFKKT